MNKKYKFKKMPKLEIRPPFEEWIENKIKQILEMMLLDFVDLKVTYCDKKYHNSSEVIFSINYTKHYRNGAIFIYPEAENMYKNNEQKTLVKALIHELSHIHTIPLSELARQRFISEKEIQEANEEITEVMAQYIRKYVYTINPDIYK